jgi:hypothetical protein
VPTRAVSRGEISPNQPKQTTCPIFLTLLEMTFVRATLITMALVVAAVELAAALLLSPCCMARVGRFRRCSASNSL